MDAVYILDCYQEQILNASFVLVETVPAHAEIFIEFDRYNKVIADRPNYLFCLMLAFESLWRK